jgi:spore maturation protein CgeB
MTAQKLKVLFIGVFDTQNRSTNNSQLLSLNKAGASVVGYNYREKAIRIGKQARDRHIIETIRQKRFDLVIFSKCSDVSIEVFIEAKKIAKTCLWFMDPIISYTEEMRMKTSVVSYFCCDKKNVLEEAVKINKNSYHVFEGFDSNSDKPQFLDKKYDVAFIGSLYGNRREQISNIKPEVIVFSNVFGKEHAKIVSQTKINLNFCTSEGASDRIYKVLAAGGFLLTNDWKGREEIFKDNKDLVIFKDIEDLNFKIEYFLKNPENARLISAQGMKTVQKFTRDVWAKRILEIYESC